MTQSQKMTTKPLSYAAALSKGLSTQKTTTTTTTSSSSSAVNLPKKQDIIPIYDIGINLGSAKYRNYHKTLLENAFKASVRGVISISNSRSEWELNIKLCDQFKDNDVKIFCTIGVHPHDAKSVDVSNLQDFQDSIIDFICDHSPATSATSATSVTSVEPSKHKKVVAIGECGLDYNRMFSPKNVQIQVFKAHIEVAAYLDLPLYIHERDSGEDMIRLLTEAKQKHPNLRGVIHCFTGKKDTMMAYLKLGFYVGVTGWICDDRRNKDLLDAVKSLPLDRLMVETDGPWLTPPEFVDAHQTTRNESSSLPYIIERIAITMGYSTDTIKEASLKNTQLLFGI